MTMDELKRTMREAYNAASVVTREPEVIAINGAVLNAMRNTDEFDEHEAYHVTKDGITRVERP